MNLGKTIQLCIAFIVAVFAFNFISLFILPQIKVGIPSLPPVEIMKTGYSILNSAFIQISGYIILVLLIVWVLYKIIVKIPLIGKIIIKKVPIFSACKNSGLFGLFDNLLGVIFSRASLPDRFVRLFKGLIDFSKNSIGFLVTTTSDMLPTFNTKSVDKTKPKPKKSSDPSFIPSDNDYIQDQLQMCLEENLIEITPDMTDADKKYAKIQNQTTNTTCKTKQLQVIMENMSWKLPN